jgi:hypothetical protein
LIQVATVTGVQTCALPISLTLCSIVPPQPEMDSLGPLMQV